MQIKIDQVKELREKTSFPVMECRLVLEEAGGDLVKAEEILNKKGILKAEKKADRATNAGWIESYTHNGGKIGVLVEVFCETDFVARNEEFKKLVHELVLQVASMNPENLEQLLSEPWIRDESKTIDQLVKETVGKLGENIKVNRFVRFELGE